MRPAGLLRRFPGRSVVRCALSTGRPEHGHSAGWPVGYSEKRPGAGWPQEERPPEGGNRYNPLESWDAALTPQTPIIDTEAPSPRQRLCQVADVRGDKSSYCHGKPCQRDQPTHDMSFLSGPFIFGPPHKEAGLIDDDYQTNALQK